MSIKTYSVYGQSSDTNLFKKTQHKISSICSFGNLMFLGTHDGHILQVVFEEIEEQCTCFSYCVIFQRRISETTISRLQASQHAELVVVLSASKINFFDAEKLELSNLRSSIDGVSTFSLSDSPLTAERHAMLAVCSKNQTLYIFRVIKSRIDLVNTISLPSVALSVSCSDSYALFATSTKYFGVDLKTKKSFEILDRTGNREQPLIQSISENEFLLSGPGSLGIFVKTNGQSDKPPITLSANLFDLFCRNQLVFAIDDEFVSIYSVSFQQQVQTIVVNDACAACMSLNRDLVFVASNSSEISVIRPETWDLEARRLISAGCLDEASALIDSEYAKLVEICSLHQATSTGAKTIFSVRSKRVYNLMGMHYFEAGQFDQCRRYFEKSSLDIRELLYRYVDLLPSNGCEITFHPPPTNIFDLSDSSGISITAYRQFLLQFLLDNRRGRIFDKHTKLVETAIIKLHVQLSEGRDSIYDSAYSTWEELVASISTVEMDDLLDFLEVHQAFHVRALILRWNGDIESALEIWKSLTLGSLTDRQFPGPKSYLDALCNSSGQNGDLVARHLTEILPHETLASDLLSRLACINSTSISLSPSRLLKSLLPHYPSLAEEYLFSRIFKAGDKDTSRHTLLAELQMQLLLKYAEEKDEDRLNTQRRRFRRSLFELTDCKTERLLETLINSPQVNGFMEEQVTLLGKLGRYEEALELLLTRSKDGLDAALRFCSWCTNQAARQLVSEQSAIWFPDSEKTQVEKGPSTDAYTVLLKILLRGENVEALKQATSILEMDLPSLDFVEVCKSLPETWRLHGTLEGFLRTALKRTACRVSVTDMEVGLTSRLATVARAEAAEVMAKGLTVSEASICAQCRKPLEAFGPQRPFAWVLQPEQAVVHLHCLKADSRI